MNRFIALLVIVMIAFVAPIAQASGGFGMLRDGAREATSHSADMAVETEHVSHRAAGHGEHGADCMLEFCMIACGALTPDGPTLAGRAKVADRYDIIEFDLIGTVASFDPPPPRL